MVVSTFTDWHHDEVTLKLYDVIVATVLYINYVIDIKAWQSVCAMPH